MYLRVVCEIEPSRGRCQACHRRDFNVRYFVVIRSIRILAGILHAIASRRWERVVDPSARV
jgi:hypothetical protein